MRAPFFAILTIVWTLPAWAGGVDYARDVRPIFERACYSCHGPAKQKGELRLDVRALAMKGGETGAAIVPGKSAESLLIKLVRGEDADRMMPAKGPALTAAEIDVLRRWIDEGANWPDDGVKLADKRDHWSLKPVARVSPPSVRDSAWVKNDVDRFVLARLEKEGIRPRPEADRRTLIRRVTLDVIGLPPTPGEIEAFLADTSADAYEKLVDRLLASPRFGERWARHWLDVVRYADSHGFEMNQPRANAWPYRDWVIGAFNADMPYDEFVREQIAGDASEGSGVRVQGSGNAKADTPAPSSPSSLNPEPRTLNPSVATGFLVAGPMDQVKSPDPGLTAQQRADELHDMVAVTSSTFLGLTVGCARCHDHKFDPISQVDYYRMVAVLAGVRHGDRAIATPPETRREMAAVEAAIKAVDAKLARFIPSAPATAAGELRPAVNSLENEERFPAVEARFVRFTVLATNNGAQPCIDELEVFAAGDGGRNVALASSGARPSSSGNFAGEPHKLEYLNDGRYGNGRSWISNEAGRGWAQVELARVEKIDRIVWGRDREGRYKDRTPTAYRIEVATDAKGPWTLVASEAGRRPFDPGAPAKVRYVAKTRAEQADLDALLAEQATLTTKAARLADAGKVYAGVFERPGPTFRLHRGEALAKREEVAPGGVGALSPALYLPKDAPEQRRRVALAEWITDPANPLTARVIVNRLWHYHFGQGLVATPSDFGHMGARPTHPELLDWLAGALKSNGWRLKAIHRLIVTSAAYRQSSDSDEKGRAVDGDATLLWRSPPRRLEAEAVRDSILAVSGKLDLTMGGPGFDFFKPNGNYVRVFEPKEEFGPAEFRRMIYAVRPRMQADGVFGAFDCPDAGQSQPRRPASTTPLQALNLLNSRFVLDQAQFFGERLKREAGEDVAAQARLGFVIALGREPTAAEREGAARLIRGHGLAAFGRAMFNASEFIYVR